MGRKGRCKLNDASKESLLILRGMTELPILYLVEACGLLHGFVFLFLSSGKAAVLRVVE